MSGKIDCGRIQVRPFAQTSKGGCEYVVSGTLKLCANALPTPASLPGTVDENIGRVRLSLPIDPLPSDRIPNSFSCLRVWFVPIRKIDVRSNNGVKGSNKASGHIVCGGSSLMAILKHARRKGESAGRSNAQWPPLQLSGRHFLPFRHVLRLVLGRREVACRPEDASEVLGILKS
jgi:hypothetical protein